MESFWKDDNNPPVELWCLGPSKLTFLMLHFLSKPWILLTRLRGFLLGRTPWHDCIIGIFCFRDEKQHLLFLFLIPKWPWSWLFLWMCWPVVASASMTFHAEHLLSLTEDRELGVHWASGPACVTSFCLVTIHTWPDVVWDLLSSKPGCHLPTTPFFSWIHSTNNYWTPTVCQPRG